ncbi:MAG: amino acid adenylation domain-containing protein [Pyrinomonadaceae bacterium]|nr:amino acid adenylation domain-containing protein [Pyrinomonadaceae bacterium]
MIGKSDLPNQGFSLSLATRLPCEEQLRGGFAIPTQPQIIPQRPKQNPVPLSFAQERLWFLNQFNPDGFIHSNPTAIRLTGVLNVGTLEQCINEIIRRHEVLRTAFTAVDGRPAQVIIPIMRVTLPEISLSELPSAEREVEARQLSNSEAQRTFDLARGPLVRVLLLRLNAEEHVLLLNMHRIVSDGWSIDVFTRELAALYEAFSTGETSPLPELPIQYADYAVWQRECAQGEALEKHLSYWKQQLSGAPAVLKLPTDHPRPAVQGFRGARQSIILSTDKLDALKSLSLRERATLFMTSLAAFQTLLWRYTGQEDVIVGAEVAGRTRDEIEKLIGVFVNHLVVRTDLSGDPSFRELLRRVREVTLGAYEHQDLPFEKLIDELQPERSLSHTPVFQVSFALQDAPPQDLKSSISNANHLEGDSAVAHFDLAVKIIEEAEELSCVFEYNTDLFAAATIARMLGHFQVLVEAIIANPEQQLSALPILTEAERYQLLVEWNDTKADYPHEQCIHELFEAQVERTPEAIAAVFEKEQLTFGELNSRANQLAHYLRKRGVGVEVPVGICMERSTEMLVGLLGILKVGAAYVPLDPVYPQERLRFMLVDAAVPVLLTQRRLLEAMPELPADFVCLDSDWETIATESSENPESGARAQNLAYVIYTSGSTGKPKGVLIEHRALVNHSLAIARHYQLSPGDRILQFASLSFDVAAEELFPTWLSGATVVLQPGQGAASLKDFLLLIEQEKITVVNVPTPYWHEWVTELSAPGDRLPPPLRLVVVGTDKALAERLAIWQKVVAGRVRWINAYGPTEATITATTYEAGRLGDGESVDLVPIGRPLPNKKIYILDRHLQPVPVGVAGELHIGGIGLARGYLNRPELTAERFIPDPFSPEAGARLYKTGDLARYLADGNIEFLGRIDHQVKIRGFRIELGEIEASLSRHPTVRGTVVVAREETPGEKRLVAYVAGNEEGPIRVDELRRFLKEKLPAYMVPSAFVLLDELPLTSSGKVDRRALPAPEQTRTEQDGAFVAPRNELELQLTKMWEKVLGVQPVGVTDNFFDLGGHSLLAVRLFAQIEKVFGKNLPLATLFQAPTVEQLIPVVSAQESSAPWSSLVPVQPGGSEPPFFGVHGALANVLMYRGLAHHLGPDQPVYGLQAQGLDGKHEPYTRVEEMAAHYITELRTVQPEGPYYLGGVSFGGIVAFEMAQQLHAQGDKVPLLALFNTDFPGRPKLMPYPESYHHSVDPYFAIIERQLAELRQLKTKKYILTRIKGIKVRISRRIWKIAAEPYSQIQNLDGFATPVIGKIWNACTRAERDYVPQNYPGRITLFWASEAPVLAHNDTRLGWGEVAGDGLEVHVVPGDHGTMREEPHVGILAEKLTACLQRAHAAASSGQT